MLSELYGDTLIEQAKCDSIVDFCEDVVFASYFVHGARDELGCYPTTEKVSSEQASQLNPRKKTVNALKSTRLHKYYPGAACKYVFVAFR